MAKNDFGLVFWAHLIVILVFISSPFWLGWQWILLLVILFVIQDKTAKNCVLTKAQFKDREDIVSEELSFYVYYFKKMGLKINAKKIKKYFAWSLLWVVFIFAVFWQLDLGQSPWWFANLF
ncbi:hypothetical protein KKH39_01955 [Patescibacteria group bacterium]|nr:hypothetical protein [Patescibacteria group bacterium]